MLSLKENFCKFKTKLKFQQFYQQLIHIIEVQMKNKRKYILSNQKQRSSDSKKNNDSINKELQFNTADFYGKSRNSQADASPRSNNKDIEKYKTYLQFIANNKLTTGNFQIQKNYVMNLYKNYRTPVPRKDPHISYLKGRKSAFQKLSQPVSPTSSSRIQRNSFPKSLPHKSKKQNKRKLSFVIQGKIVKNTSNLNDRLKKQGENLKQILKQQEKNKVNKKNYIDIFSKTTNQIAKYNIMTLDIKALNTKNKTNLQKINQYREQQQKFERQQAKLHEKLFQGIHFYKDLGKGAHALVKSAVDWNNTRKIAVKIYEKSQLLDEQIHSIQKQIQILMSLNHPNIIKLYDIIQSYKTINLIMQYGGGNSLDQYIKSKLTGYLTQKQSKIIFKQVLQAVKYMHQKNITHRDIKAENILLNKHLQLKIIDFGFSLVVDKTNKNINSYCGTPTYMAPQVVSKIPHNALLADCWSLGILLFYILNGNCPFRASTQKQLFIKINKCQYEYSCQINSLAKDLINKLLKKNAQNRLTASEALLHPWLFGE